jgi:hypothetical protein
MENLDRIEFQDVACLADQMYSTIEDLKSVDDYAIVAAIGHYQVIKELLEYLIACGTEIDGLIELEDEEFNNYDREFVLCLGDDGVTVEKLYRDGEYIDWSFDVNFLHEDCNSALLGVADDDVVAFEFGYADNIGQELDYDSCDYDCENCSKVGKGSKEEKEVKVSEDDDVQELIDKLCKAVKTMKSDKSAFSTKSVSSTFSTPSTTTTTTTTKKDTEPAKDDDCQGNIRIKVTLDGLDDDELDKKIDNLRRDLLTYCHIMDGFNDFYREFLRW